MVTTSKRPDELIPTLTSFPKISNEKKCTWHAWHHVTKRYHLIIILHPPQQVCLRSCGLEMHIKWNCAPTLQMEVAGEMAIWCGPRHIGIPNVLGSGASKKYVWKGARDFNEIWVFRNGNCRAICDNRPYGNVRRRRRRRRKGF